MRLFFAILLLTGCAQLEVVAPNPRVESPETFGKKAFQFHGGVVPSHIFEATSNGGARPPDLTSPNLTRGADLVGGGQYSFHERLDTGLEVVLLGSGINGFIKWQLNGESSVAAKEKSFPIAVFARAGTANGTESGDQSSTFGAGGYNWRGHISNSFAHVGVSAGYRLTDIFLVYGGIAGGRYWARTKIDQDATDAGTDPGGSYRASLKGHGRTAALGVSWIWPQFLIGISTQYSQIRYDGAPKLDDSFVEGLIKFSL